jgi:hypothetical protein
LPVGFVKDSYSGGHDDPNDTREMDYVGYTCAACHTGQVDYKETSIRIDGGPAMANKSSFLLALEVPMVANLAEPAKLAGFKTAVLGYKNDYTDPAEIEKGLNTWKEVIYLYNEINKSDIEYGHARLDAFGRIYHRFLEHLLNAPQNKRQLSLVAGRNGSPLLSDKKSIKSKGCEPDHLWQRRVGNGSA